MFSYFGMTIFNLKSMIEFNFINQVFRIALYKKIKLGEGL